MCWSQILVVLGLIFEFSSVAMTQEKLFRNISKFIIKQILRKPYSTYTTTIIDKPWVGPTAFALLIVGMVLQGWSVFV